MIIEVFQEIKNKMSKEIYHLASKNIIFTTCSSNIMKCVCVGVCVLCSSLSLICGGLLIAAETVMNTCRRPRKRTFMSTTTDYKTPNLKESITAHRHTARERERDRACVREGGSWGAAVIRRTAAISCPKCKVTNDFFVISASSIQLHFKLTKTSDRECH